jgi:hypothetical protein
MNIKIKKYKKAVFLDLDGTLLNDDHKISQTNYDQLTSLSNQNILRVVATGRSMYSVHKVLPENFPIDYCIFSTGGGILDWQQKKIIKKYDFKEPDIINISNYLIEQDLDFMLHLSIPNNHKYYFRKSSTRVINKDFENRCELYDGHVDSLDMKNLPKTCAQFLVISEKQKDVKLFEKIKHKFSQHKVILTTSSIDKSSTWIEIFPKQVSKGLAGKFLIENFNIFQKNTMAIGNDYNDIDLLDWADASFVVENAPIDLKEKYINVPSNNNDGFNYSVESWLTQK